MTALQEFKFNTSTVRIVMIDGNPWWVAKDVCAVLEISNVPDAVSSLDNDEKLVSSLPISGQYRDVNIINESGLFNLVLSSRKPEAKKFKKWVTSEVLPQIRKTGSYSLEAKLIYPTDPHDQVIALCDKLKAMTLEAKQLTQKILEQQPKVDGWNEFIGCDGLVELNHVAQICKTGRNTLFKKLRDEKVFYYKGAYNSVYQQYVDSGYFEMKMVPNEELGPIPVIKCTTKGAEWIYNKFYRKAA